MIGTGWLFYFSYRMRNMACWCILTTFRTDYILVTICLFASFWWHFNLVKRVTIRGFGAFSWGRMGEMAGLKHGMLMYPDYLQNLLDFGHGLLLFIIFVVFAPWHRVYLIGPWGLRGAAAIRSPDLLVFIRLQRRGPQYCSDNVQIMAYFNQRWPSLLTYILVIRPRWVINETYIKSEHCLTKPPSRLGHWWVIKLLFANHIPKVVNLSRVNQSVCRLDKQTALIKLNEWVKKISEIGH